MAHFNSCCKALIAPILLLATCYSLPAQSQTVTYTFEGVIDEVNVSAAQESHEWLNTIDTFSIRVRVLHRRVRQQEEASTPVDSSGIVSSIEYQLKSNGSTVFTPLVVSGKTPISNMYTSGPILGDRLRFRSTYMTKTKETTKFNISVQQMITPFLDFGLTVPRVLTGDYEAAIAIGYQYTNPEPALNFTVIGRTISVIGTIDEIVMDSDEDQVPDSLDNCEASLLSETVLLNSVDSGVTNYVDASGCSVMDHYAACSADEEEEVQRFSRRSRSFYRGPSYCEKQVAYNLVRDGLIDYSEARALRDALYSSAR